MSAGFMMKNGLTKPPLKTKHAWNDARIITTVSLIVKNSINLPASNKNHLSMWTIFVMSEKTYMNFTKP